MPNISRRSLLKLAGLGATATFIYSYIRGIRFPVLSWESSPTVTSTSMDKADVVFKDLINTSNDRLTSSFRAFAPEPEIQLAIQDTTTITLLVNNIAIDAILTVNDEAQSNVKEEINNLNRKITIATNGKQSLKLKWRLPELSQYTFAAIGDTGGDTELAWCIRRAHDLGARFFLHLGDFNYQPGDYDNAIEQFNNAPLPCYVSIGNHDFKDSGLKYQQFLNAIGPLNNTFSIGKTRYINIDTAASFLPYSGGLRGKLIQQLVDDPSEYNDNVVFTHRPLHDPQPLDVREKEGDHDIGSQGEKDWLISSLKKIKATTLLSGHIHIFDRSNYRGIDNIIVGQGLGHQDLLVNHNGISKMALGHVNQNGKVNYEFASLEMPMEFHCHPHVQVVKDSIKHLPHIDTINEIDIACNKQG